eukprot:g278.t1
MEKETVFNETFLLSIYLLFLYCNEKAFTLLKLPSLLGAIVAGAILGPCGTNIIPFPIVIATLGKLGVQILTLDASLVINTRSLEKIFLRAASAATVGTMGPILLTMLVLCGFFGETFTTGFVVGAALAPTSMGYSLQLLTKAGLVKQKIGILVISAAVIDDVISILLYSQAMAFVGIVGTTNTTTNNTGKANETALTHNTTATLLQTLHPTFSGILALLLGFSLYAVVPRCFTILIQKYPEMTQTLVKALSPSLNINGDVPNLERALVLTLFVGCMCALITSALGSSDLLGCFLAGITITKCISTVDSLLQKQSSSSDSVTEHVSSEQVNVLDEEEENEKGEEGNCLTWWTSSMTPLVQWSNSLFFGATIAFSFPNIGTFFHGTAITRAILLFLTAFLGKLFLSPFAPRTSRCNSNRFLEMLQFGFAMSGRGEFSFLIAVSGRQTGILSELNFKAITLALLLLIGTSPFLFRLSQYMLKNRALV